MVLWDGERLADKPEVVEFLYEQIRREPLLAALSDIRHEEQMPGDMGTFFRAVWKPTGQPVFVKLNATAIELEWMSAIAHRTARLVPRVYASGQRLADMDVGWLVLQRTPCQFDPGCDEDCRKLMLAAAHFQQVAENIDKVTYAPIDVEFLEWCLPEAIKANCPGAGEAVLARLHRDITWMDAEFPRVRCHGDVHFDNAVSEVSRGPLLLIDPMPRTANWAWDAAYAQILSGVQATPRLVPLLAAARRSLGLPTGDPAAVERLETVLLAWSSMLWWGIKPFRRDDPWFRTQVTRNVQRLASLRH